MWLKITWRRAAVACGWDRDMGWWLLSRECAHTGTLKVFQVAPPPFLALQLGPRFLRVTSGSACLVKKLRVKAQPPKQEWEPVDAGRETPKRPQLQEARGWAAIGLPRGLRPAPSGRAPAERRPPHGPHPASLTQSPSCQNELKSENCSAGPGIAWASSLVVSLASDHYLDNSVWLTGSWCSGQVSGLCLWGGRAEFRTLVHQRPPGSM